MRGIGTAAWVVVLAGSTLAIGAGFLGGSALGKPAVPPAVQSAPGTLPADLTVVERDDRTLRGIHSLEAGEGGDPDALDDPNRSVAERLTPPAHGGEPRVALIVVDASSAGDALAPLREVPFPLAFVLDPADERAAAETSTLHAAGRRVLASATRAGVARSVAKLGVDGVFGSLEGMAARRLSASLPPESIVVDDATDDGALYAAARASHRAASARDIVVDAREGERYADFLFSTALGIARRQGTAVVALHARPATLRALARFANRASREGIALVDIAAVATRS